MPNAAVGDRKLGRMRPLLHSAMVASLAGLPIRWGVAGDPPILRGHPVMAIGPLGGTDLAGNEGRGKHERRKTRKRGRRGGAMQPGRLLCIEVGSDERHARDVPGLAVLPCDARRRAPLASKNELAQSLPLPRSEVALPVRLGQDARIGCIANRQAG